MRKLSRERFKVQICRGGRGTSASKLSSSDHPTYFWSMGSVFSSQAFSFSRFPVCMQLYEINGELLEVIF